jgi:type II secretory pathway pseudopilin PulG
MATVLLIALTAALPSVYQEGQREREEELIFRGGQYARAIALFRRQFRRYPTEVKELLQTNGIRFLRKAYPDPMSRKGKWRFIHANAAGVLLDSKLQVFTPRPGGSTGTVGGLSQNPSAGSAGGMRSQTSSAFFGEGQEIKGAFIVGVASTNHRESIRVWNTRTRYDEWEFLGVELNPLGLPGATFTFGQAGGAQMPSGSAPPGGATGQAATQGQSSTPAGPPLPPQPSAPGESGQQPAPDQP